MSHDMRHTAVQHDCDCDSFWHIQYTGRHAFLVDTWRYSIRIDLVISRHDPQLSRHFFWADGHCHVCWVQVHSGSLRYMSLIRISSGYKTYIAWTWNLCSWIAELAERKLQLHWKLAGSYRWYISTGLWICVGTLYDLKYTVVISCVYMCNVS